MKMYTIISNRATKAIKFCLLLFIGFSLNGCEDFYMPPKNEFPGEDALTSTLNLELIINGAYAPIGKYHSSDYMIISELFGGSSLIYVENGSRNQNYVNIRNFDLNANTSITNNAWTDCYKAINRANIIIEAITVTKEPLDNFYETQKNRLLGEAYLIRALGNFDLIKLFGTQYSETNKSKPGIILRTNSSTGENFGSRSNVGNAYDLIVSDLKQAITLLPIKYDSNEHGNFQAYKYRGTRKAASALLAKVYFQMNEIDLALNQINATIGDVPGKIVAVPSVTGSTAPALERGSRYTNIFTPRSKDLANKEVVFNFNNVEPEVDFTSSLRKAIFNDSQAYFEGIFYYSESISNDIFNYSDAYGKFTDSLDVRYVNFVGTITQNNSKDTLLHSQKFGYRLPDDPITVSTYLNIGVIRSVELLLMRAEIYALKGNLPNAQLDYNAVTERAGIGKISAPLPYPELMSRIMVERMKELDMEGDIFWHWKRMGAYTDQSKYLGIKYAYQPFIRNGKTYNWDSPETLAKIPQDEINNNPEIAGQQNP
jgi:starch-binding outer membrane protein, SusD/RagB family